MRSIVKRIIDEFGQDSFLYKTYFSTKCSYATYIYDTGVRYAWFCHKFCLQQVDGSMQRFKPF